MEKINHGISPSGFSGLEEVQNAVISKIEFDFFVLTTESNSPPGTLGGTIYWNIYGANDNDCLLKFLSNKKASFYQRTSLDSFEEVKKELLAKNILLTMNEVDINLLFERFMIRLLLGEI